MLKSQIDQAARAAVLAEVIRVARPSARLVRVTFALADATIFSYDGPDHLVRVFFPLGNQDRPTLPVTTDWWTEVQELPKAIRPIVRNYTVRRYDPDRAELDIDFVLHGNRGPASCWAHQAAPGQRLGLRSERAGYQPIKAARWQLLVGDETALPAISAIVEALPASTKAAAFIEIAHPDDRQQLETLANVDIRWLSRDGAVPGTSDVLLQAVRSAHLPAEPVYAWVAGESGMVTAVRRHLVCERSVPRESIYFCGYWKYTKKLTLAH